MQTVTATATAEEEGRRELNLVVMGLPGSGKGTQSQKIAEKYGLRHVSSGDLLREEMKRDTPRGREIQRHMQDGTLFPDELVDAVLLDSMPRCNYVLDGYPRRVSQTGAIKGVNMAIYLSLDEDEIIRRILARGQGREDDNEEALGVRIRAFKRETEPVLEHYREAGLLRVVDASGTPDEVFGRVEDEIARL